MHKPHLSGRSRNGESARTAALRGRVAAALLSFVLRAISGVAQEATPEDLELWIRRLGAPAHAEREEASAALWRIGEAALEQLQEAERDPDPEIAMRAGRLRADISDGFRPDWPEALRRLLRGYDRLPDDQRLAALDQLIRDRGDEAAAFLLRRLQRDGADGASAVAERLESLAESAQVRRWLLDRMRAPRHEPEARVLATVCLKEGGPVHLARALGAEHVPSPLRHRLTSSALEHLHARLQAGEFERVAQDAAAPAAATPNEARFVYYEAAGAAHLHDSARAESLLMKALSLNPDSETPHWEAAEMLTRMDQANLAAREWQRILEIPPENDVYDMNAHFRLGGFFAENRRFAQAADAYERGLNDYRSARERGGSGMGLLGGSEEDLVELIARYRAMVRPLTEAAPQPWSIQIESRIKGDRTEEWLKISSTPEIRMTVNVQPYGFRIFESAPVTLKYDRARGELVMLLDDTTTMSAIPNILKKGITRVLVDSLDMRYLFEIDSETGTSVKRMSVELDYIMFLKPPDALRAWRNPELIINDQPYTWEDLDRGIPFDILPQEIKLLFRGTDPDGEAYELSSSFSLNPPNPAEPAPPVDSDPADAPPP
ncbi:MAG: hypothetical protein KBA51_01180 [Kiritimatiellae bacterium]|nr:hypothetical protein [Kiritimatiellia bacterium]